MNNSILVLITILINLTVYSQTSRDFFYSASKKHNDKDYKGAIEDYNQAIALEPDSGMYFCSRGMANFCLEGYNNAIEDYTKALELDYNNDVVYNYRANAKSKQKNYKGALEDYSKAIEVNPNYYFAFMSRGELKDFLKDYKGAISDFTRAKEIFTTESEPYFLRANAKQKIKDYLGAIEDYDAYEKLKGGYSPQIFFGRGICKILSNQEEGGCKDLNRVPYSDENKAKALEAIKKYCK